MLELALYVLISTTPAQLPTSCQLAIANLQARLPGIKLQACIEGVLEIKPRKVKTLKGESK